jgi:hypothetical protein
MAHQVLNLTNDEYRAQRGYSKSDLDYIHQSPALLEWASNAPSVGSDAVDLGTHVHCAVLEPDIFAGTYRKAPESGRNAADRSRVEAFAEHCKVGGKICLDADTYDMVIAMRDSIMAHPTARELLTSPGVSESSIFGELEGVRVKCRPDRIVDGRHILVDVKKVDDIDHLARSIQKFRYYVQAPFYSDIYEQWTGHKPRFIFVAVGERRSIGRHPVRVFELEQAWVEAGRQEYLDDLERVREMEAFGVGMHVEALELPRWARS